MIKDMTGGGWMRVGESVGLVGVGEYLEDV